MRSLPLIHIEDNDIRNWYYARLEDEDFVAALTNHKNPITLLTRTGRFKTGCEVIIIKTKNRVEIYDWLVYNSNFSGPWLIVPFKIDDVCVFVINDPADRLKVTLTYDFEVIPAKGQSMKSLASQIRRVL